MTWRVVITSEPAASASGLLLVFFFCLVFFLSIALFHCNKNYVEKKLSHPFHFV